MDLKVAMSSLSVHEAAHAVVAWRCGLQVDLIKMEYGWWSGDLLSGFTRVRGDYCEEESMDWAATTTAGAVAQERFLLERGVDAGAASRMADFGGSLDADDMVDMVREFGVSPAAAHGRAQLLIDRHWSRILEVGEMLDERGRVAGRVAR